MAPLLQFKFMAVEYKEEMASEVVEEPTSEEVTASLPVSILAGKTVAPGDVVRLEVVSLDDEGGNVVVRYAAEAPAPEKAEGISGMAAEFD